MKTEKFKEHVNRSLVKALTFRVIIIITNAVIVFVITGKSEATFSIVAFSSITSTLIYFMHERVWNKIHWGKHKAGD